MRQTTKPEDIPLLKFLDISIHRAHNFIAQDVVATDCSINDDQLLHGLLKGLPNRIQFGFIN
jgi:hypothetical protein